VSFLSFFRFVLFFEMYSVVCFENYFYGGASFFRKCFFFFFFLFV
jgi:hypothetical protein